jgi:O-antigen/teichoic acid export membrane protein
MFTELASCIAALTLNIIGYRYGGFAGLGYAYCGWYVIYTIIIGTVYTKRYDLSIDKRLYAYIAYGLTICAATLYLAVSPLGSILVAAVACAVSARTLQRL